MFNNTNSTEHHFYDYVPSRKTPVIFGWLYIISTGLLILMVLSCGFSNIRKFRSWRKHDLNLRYFGAFKLMGAYIPLIIGLAMETLGLAGRSISVIDQQGTGPYILQVLLLLVAPTLYAATIYMLFGRLTYLLYAEKILIMPARFNTAIFVIGDIVSLVMQTAGSSMRANASTVKSGTGIASAGLYIQLAFFGLFIINEMMFYIRIRNIPSQIHKKFKLWKFANLILLFNSILVLIRSIVRTAEFRQGDHGYITEHEWCLYAFDTALMFTVGVTFTISMPFLGIFKLQICSVKAQIDEANDVKNKIIVDDFTDNMNADTQITYDNMSGFYSVVGTDMKEKFKVTG